MAEIHILQTRSKISNDNEIGMYLHCGRCVQEAINQSIAPRDYARLEVGYTKKGLQVWCIRHNLNVINIDFEGQKHPANVTAHDR